MYEKSYKCSLLLIQNKLVFKMHLFWKLMQNLNFVFYVFFVLSSWIKQTV